MLQITYSLVLTVLSVVVLLALVVVGTILLVSASKKRKAAVSVKTDHDVTGSIIAVKQKKREGKDKGFRVESLLQYTNPESGVVVVTPCEFSLATKNMPELLKVIGAGISDAMVNPRDFAAYRRQIISQGVPDYKVRELLLERVSGNESKMPVLVDGNPDENGYVLLTAPIDVTVQLHPETSTETSVSVIFRATGDTKK